MSEICTVLYPTDFSESSGAAFRLPCSLAQDCDARLVVLHVYPPPAPPEWTDYRPPGEVERALTARLYELRPTHRETPVDYRLVAGCPASVILSVAREVRADLIVMGTHGRSGFRRVILGSVAEAVMRKATCPVVTVRPVARVAGDPVPVGAG